MRKLILVLLAICATQPAAAQIVINRDGTLPTSSVSESDYPGLVRCTIEKRRPDIEIILVARQDLSERKLNQGTVATEQDYDALQVVASDGRHIDEARLFVEIVASCHPLRQGYPLGFWPDTLYADWQKELSFSGLYSQRLNDEQFAQCLARYRRPLVDRYLEETRRPEAASIYAGFFTQRVCTPSLPRALREKRVREALVKLQGR